MTQIQQMVRGGRGKEWNLIVLERDEGSKLCIYSSGFLFIRFIRSTSSDVLVPAPLPLPLQVLNTISGCTLDQGISIYELIKKVGQHGFGENIK